MDPREGKEREVAQLAGPRMPADHGLSSLGLLMQLGGSLFLGGMVVFSVSSLFASEMSGWFFLLVVCGAGAVRSGLHRAAGTALLYGSERGPFRPTCTYVAFSVAPSESMPRVPLTPATVCRSERTNSMPNTPTTSRPRGEPSSSAGDFMRV